MLNRKKLYRLYREVTDRAQTWQSQAGSGDQSTDGEPAGQDQRWSLNFVSDALTNRRGFRIITVVDNFSRECPALVVDNSLFGIRVARELDRIVEMRG